MLHATIKKVTEDIETLTFNTAISQMMIFVNAFTNAPAKPVSAMRTLPGSAQSVRAAPHLGALGDAGSNVSGRAATSPSCAWPEHDERFLVEDEIEIVLQVNGKLRDKMTVADRRHRTPSWKRSRWRTREFKELIAGKPIRKVVVVPKKLVNMVAN